jgi:hypothetical protein
MGSPRKTLSIFLKNFIESVMRMDSCETALSGRFLKNPTSSKVPPFTGEVVGQTVLVS